MSYEFQWDDTKDRSNFRKHGIRFEEAMAVFTDPFRITTFDRIEDNELRWRTIGVMRGITVIVVAHTVVDGASEGDAPETIRIISARWADRKERKEYEHKAG